MTTLAALVAAGRCPACHRYQPLDDFGHLVPHPVPAQPVTGAVCWGGAGHLPQLAEPVRAVRREAS